MLGRMCLQTLGRDPSQCAYLCRHKLIGIRRARELEAEGWGSLSLSASFPWRSIHSSSIHSMHRESPSPCQAQWGTAKQKSAYTCAGTCIWNTCLKGAEHRALSRQYLRQAGGKMAQAESIYVKDLSLFNKALHTEYTDTPGTQQHWINATTLPSWVLINANTLFGRHGLWGPRINFRC